MVELLGGPTQEGVVDFRVGVVTQQRGVGEDEDDDIDLPNNYDEEDDDSFDEEELTEESYRTTFDAEPEELEMEGEAISDEEDAY